MKPLLYLDTARLGQMSPAAQRAQADFARFAGQFGAAVKTTDLIERGIESCEPAIHDCLPGLKTWPGIARLKLSLRRLAHLHDELPLLLASRSAELMKLAALLLCRSSRNVLVTDLDWTPYHRLLQAECCRAHRRMTVVSLANDVLAGKISSDEVVTKVSSEFVRNHCDALFITAVSNRGARLPVQRIVREIDDKCRFVVVDGAQDFCHVGLDVSHDCCDLYLAGCHKWLGGFHPLGIAFYGRRRSRSVIETALSHALKDMQVDDPLLRFIEVPEDRCEGNTDETVNLAALFSCGGAVHDAICGETARQGIECRFENAHRVAEVALAAGWKPCLLDPSLRSGITLLEAIRPTTRLVPAELLRRKFHERGVALSAYEGGILRLSMPAIPFESHDMAALGDALKAIA